MTEYEMIKRILIKDDISFREQEAYDENNIAYPCLWLDSGHIEFSKDKKIKNVVLY